MRWRVFVRGLGLLLVAALLASCVSLPENGPVEEADLQAAREDDGGGFDPPPPETGATAREIVEGFLTAMTAVPVSETVATEYLHSNARDDWDPDNQIITYDSYDLVGSNPVQMRLFGAEQLDERGAWVRKLTPEESTLTVPISLELNERRISEAPDALVVRRDWFNREYRRMSVYFFDAAGTVLVPEPVFVPRRDQLALSLLRSLLRGPPRGDGYIISRTFMPGGRLPEEAMVDVDATGLADVSLPGTGVPLSTDNARRLIAQLQWTLRQDVAISRLRVTVGDRLIAGVGGATEFEVDGGEEYDPAWRTPPTMYAVNDGSLGEVVEDTWSPVQGAFGGDGYRLRHGSVDLDGTLAAGVSQAGSRVYLAEIDDSDGEVSEVMRGADVLPPAWDVSGRLWLLDRTSAGAKVWVYRNGVRKAIIVPGISGKPVIDFLVSRDGTRLVAAIRTGAGGHAIVVSRIVSEVDGVPVAGTPARTAYAGEDLPLVIRDLAWSAQTAVLMLSQPTGTSTRLSIVSLGASVSDAPEEVGPVLGDMVEVTSSPEPNALIFCTSARREVIRVGVGHEDDLPDRSRPSNKLRVTGLTYVG